MRARPLLVATVLGLAGLIPSAGAARPTSAVVATDPVGTGANCEDTSGGVRSGVRLPSGPPGSTHLFFRRTPFRPITAR
ncbi:MAG: hypothetical protein QOF16_1632 [Actinomycetota bacterium]|jgi:hypothetical protein|nr:hypothetical protein [Actinomycetota bacterium]